MKALLKTSFPFAAVAAITLSPAAIAQEGSKSKLDEYCSISKVLGASVRMNAGAEAKREAEKEGEPAKQPTGKVADVLVDSETGALDCAVVAFGGFAGIGDKTVAVPFSALTWNQAQEHFELAASEDRMKALPSFDVGKARNDGMDEARAVAHSHWRAGARTDEAGGPIGETKEAATTKPVAVKAIPGTKFFSIPTRFLCATEIDDYPVYATSEKVGSISDLLVERSKSAITLAILKHGSTLGMGGTEYLVPFRAIRTCTSGDEKILCMNCAANELETAVVYEKPKNGIVDPEAAKRALASHTFEKGDKPKRISDGR